MKGKDKNLESAKNNTTTEKLNLPEKKQLSGFNLDEYIAKPMEFNITLQKNITTIPAKRPNPQQFFRIHPTLEVTVDVIEWKEDGLLYIVKQDALPILYGLTKRVILHVGILYPSGSPFLFPVPQPDEKGNWNQWHRSASQVVIEGKKGWIRAQPDKSIGGYTTVSAQGDLPELPWPDKDIAEYLAIAFAGRTIDDENHPIVKSLRGVQAI